MDLQGAYSDFLSNKEAAESTLRWYAYDAEKWIFVLGGDTPVEEAFQSGIIRGFVNAQKRNDSDIQTIVRCLRTHSSLLSWLQNKNKLPKSIFMIWPQEVPREAGWSVQITDYKTLYTLRCRVEGMIKRISGEDSCRELNRLLLIYMNSTYGLKNDELRSRTISHLNERILELENMRYIELPGWFVNAIHLARQGADHEQLFTNSRKHPISQQFQRNLYKEQVIKGIQLENLSASILRNTLIMFNLNQGKRLGWVIDYFNIDMTTAKYFLSFYQDSLGPYVPERFHLSVNNKSNSYE